MKNFIADESSSASPIFSQDNRLSEAQQATAKSTNATCRLDVFSVTTPKKQLSIADLDTLKEWQVMKKTLIVDDEPDMRELLRCIYEADGYEVCEAEDGIQGLEKAEEFQPDLIVTDIMMPKMNGWQFVEALRADERMARVPVIVVTAKNSEKEVFENKGVENCQFLLKPFDLERLMTISKIMLSKHGVNRSGARSASAF